MRLVLAIVLGAAAACGGHNGGDDGLDGVTGIEVEPPVATLTVPLGGTATQDFQVFGVTRDGRREITARCSLAVDAVFGSIKEATLTALPHGGKTSVVAACGSLMGQGLLVVNLEGSVVVGPNTPPDAGTIFDNATTGSDPARAPRIEYPIDKAVSPRNIPSIEVQWTPASNDLFHIALSATFAKIDVYTTDLEALLEPAHWDSLVGSVAGEDLAIAIEGLSRAAPATKFPGTGATIRVTHDTIDKTAIYYWASSQGNIMSQTFGEPTAPSVVKGDCTSCHSVSRNGSRIGYSRCVANDCNQLYAGFLRYDGGAQLWNEKVDANGKTILGSYSTFAPVGNPFPDDDKAVALVSMSTGTLQLYDPDTGGVLPSNLAVATHGPGAPRSALMADWSADGTQVVFASSPHAGQWIDLNDGRIATMSYSYTGGQHVFGEPKFIVPDPIALAGGTYSNFFFPSFSPDGALVVFNAARAQWRNFTDAKTAGQRLMLADANGAWIGDLSALNGGPGDMDITWAHWAPNVSADYYWVVFSSERDYGHRTTLATSPASCKQNGVKQCKQIWLAAIAKSRLGAGMDPSAPPMWLPGQNALANNISPYWSVPAKLQ